MSSAIELKQMEWHLFIGGMLLCQVGELFKAAGQVLSQLGDLTVQVHLCQEQSKFGTIGKSNAKKRSHSDANAHSIKEERSEQVSPNETNRILSKQLKQPKYSEVTLMALNSSELDVGIEYLNEINPDQVSEMKAKYESTDDALLSPQMKSEDDMSYN